MWVGGWYLCFVFEGLGDFDEGVCGVCPWGGWDEASDFLEFELSVDEVAVFGVAYEAVFAFGPASPFLGVGEVFGVFCHRFHLCGGGLA